MRMEDANKLFTTITLLFVFAFCNAQGWERTYGNVGKDTGGDLIQLADGGYIVAGTTTNLASEAKEVLLFRTDPDGRQQWMTTFGGLNVDDTKKNISVQQDVHRGYIIGGTSIENEVDRGFLIRTDILGNELWRQTTESVGVKGHQVIAVSDGGYLLVGSFAYETISGSTDQMNKDVYLTKYDQNGVLLWEQTFGGEKFEQGIAAVELPNGNFVICGNTYEGEDYDVLLIHFDADGNLLANEKYGTLHKELAYDMTISPDNSTLLITGTCHFLTSTEDDIFVLRLSPSGGDEMWTFVKIDDSQSGYSIAALPDGKAVVTGEHYIPATADKELIVTVVDNSGPILIKEFGEHNFWDAGFSVLFNQSNDYTIAGTTQSYGNGNSDIYVLQTDGSNISATNTINGNLSITSGDCDQESYTKPAPNQIIQAVGSATYYTVTDEFGNYTFHVPAGEYAIWPIALSEYWDVCQDTIHLEFEGVFETIDTFYTIHPHIVCPIMQTDIAVNHLRPGFQSTYTLTYCNNGSEIADGALLHATFDEFLHIDSTSVPELLANDNEYIFSLGDVPIFDCASIQVYATLDSTAVIGQTHCVESYVTPDTLCIPLDPNWNQASIKVDAFCEYDSVKFKIQNEGWGDMDVPLDFIIIEDHIIGLQGEFILNSGQDTTIIVATDGATFRMEADQSFGHPGNSQPSIAVEGCGGEPFSTGYVIEFPQNDANPFLEIDCRENTSSYDPNDKQAFPRGYAEEHYIEPNTDIEYLIRFQNEGTDTAFRVVIRDTLSAFLSEYTVIPGASSHHYDFELYNSNVLKFTFNDIMLPQKDIDEMGSMGFVKFKIKQKQDNPIGTKILNDAAIYFDYNAPIITETVEHTIGENFVEIEVVSEDGDDLTTENSPIKVYPNPFDDKTTFEINNIGNQAITFSLFNLSSQLVQQDTFSTNIYQFERKNIASGMYIFRMEANGQLLGSGKIVLK